MTREEAINVLKNLREEYWNDDGYGHETQQYDDTITAIDMAIKALEKEPCDDAISRQEACDAIRKYKSVVSEPDAYDKAFDDGIDTAIAEIGHNVRPVNPQPKTGHWIMTGDYYTGAYGCIDYVECSCCHEESLEEGNFCPNCGAEMEEGEEV